MTIRCQVGPTDQAAPHGLQAGSRAWPATPRTPRVCCRPPTFDRPRGAKPDIRPAASASERSRCRCRRRGSDPATSPSPGLCPRRQRRRADAGPVRGSRLRPISGVAPRATGRRPTRRAWRTPDRPRSGRGARGLLPRRVGDRLRCRPRPIFSPAPHDDRPRSPGPCGTLVTRTVTEGRVG
jgi:hypothetical protein